MVWEFDFLHYVPTIGNLKMQGLRIQVVTLLFGRSFSASLIQFIKGFRSGWNINMFPNT